MYVGLTKLHASERPSKESPEVLPGFGNVEFADDFSENRVCQGEG